MANTPDTFHASVVALSGGSLRRADAPLAAPLAAPLVSVLLRGASGAGKSDLALRLIVGHGATLVADDRVVLHEEQGQVVAAPPDTIAGLLEVRGLGLLRLPFCKTAPVALVVDLVARGEVERLPAAATTMLCNIAVPVVRLHAFDASAPHKIIAALAVVEDAQMVVS